MAGLSGIGQVIMRVAVSYAAAAGTVFVLLAGVTLALARAILRPLRQAAELAEAAGQAAGGDLSRVMLSRGVQADGERSRWLPGMTLMRISAQMGASRAAEATVRRSADHLSERLGEVSLDLRTSVSVVRGFAEYYRQRGEPLPADLDRMMRRVAHEVARMETVIEGMGPSSATTMTVDGQGEPGGPARAPV
jgi:two-component system OmpR family sensor kinase